MKDIKINIVNASILDPSKKYILELDKETFTIAEAKQVGKSLQRMNIESIIVIKKGDTGLIIKEIK